MGTLLRSMMSRDRNCRDGASRIRRNVGHWWDFASGLLSYSLPSGRLRSHRAAKLVVGYTVEDMRECLRIKAGMNR